MGDVQQFYQRQRLASQKPLEGDGVLREGLVRRRYGSLRVLAKVYTIAGYLIIAGVVVALVIIISNSDQVSGAQFIATFIALAIVGGLYALLAIAAGEIIKLLIDVQNNTHLTAQLLDDVVDALGDDSPAPSANSPGV
jgi:hypothetical protein